MSTYSVLYIEAATGRVESVVGSGMWFSTADRLAASMQSSAREGYYFTARNSNQVPA